MRKFLVRTIVSVSLILALLVVPSFAEDEPTFEPLSPEFLKWQEEHDSSLPALTNAAESSEYKSGYIPFPVDLSHLADNPPVEDVSPVPNVKSSTLPTTFDLRNVNGKSYVTSVKSQQPYGTCWSFASIGAIESNLLMQGKSTPDLSEMHLAWYAFRGSDKSKAFLNMHNDTFATVMDHGGNVFFPAALFTRLSGPTNESNAPYGENKQPSKGSPDDYPRAVRVRDVYYLSFINSSPNVNASSEARDTVKQRIMETGAVVGNYWSNAASYYKSDSNGTNYYYNHASVNHAVQIIGWDDNYSRNNFKTKPSIDGAWLIKNSWGNTWWTGTESVGDNGCFWMSYAQNLTGGSALIAEPYDSRMQAYYYDALGWCSTLSYSGSKVYAANVFKSTRTETLTEVGFITPDNNISYEVNVYAGMSAMPSSSPIPSGGESLSTVSGTIPYAGYHTVTLNDPVALSNGEYFSVVVTFKNSAKAPVEAVAGSWSPNAVIDEGSFLSANGVSWTPGKQLSVNTTVKAFTISGTVSGIAPRIQNVLPPDAFTNKAYTLTIAASGTTPITWLTSGNIPTGLSMDASTGEISGIPTAEGSFTFSVTAKNDYGSDTRSYTVNVWDIPSIDDEEITGYVGYSLSHQMTLTPSTSATWSASNKLPAGLSLSKAGLISGKPTKEGTYSVTLKAVTDAGTSESAVTFTINAKPTKPTIKIASLKTIVVGEEFSQAIEVTGTYPITITMEGHPNGIILTGATAYMSGTPTTAGTYNVKFTAENIATELENKPVTKTVKLTVKARAPVIETPDGLDDAIVGKEYGNIGFNLSDGDEPVTWKATGLPTGMKFSSSGVLSGTPTKAGKFTISVTATNSGGSNTIKLPLVVLQPPTISSPRMPNATTDKKYSAKFTAKGSTSISWDVEGLPETLSLTQNATGTSATIAGTPVEAGEYSVTLKVSNAAGESESTVKFKVLAVAPKLNVTLARATVEQEYNETRIYATGTKPIEISYTIAASDKAKFGIESLEDLGLEFECDSEKGTASITGTPEISIKALPITFTAKNVATSTATKKVSLTVAGQKPAFTTPENATTNILCEVNTDIELDFTVKGTKNITYSMTKATGFALEQTDDYSAVLKGTAPAKDATTTITVTAANADGKATRKIVIKTQTPPTITTSSIPSGTLNKNYSAKLAATGTKTIKWAIDGDLPDGIKFNNGTFSGKPKEAGDFSFIITASNAISQDEQEFILRIIDPNAEATSLPEILPETLTEALPEESSQAETMTLEPAITFGSVRTVEPHRDEIENDGYIIAAILPEVSVNVSGMYDIEVELSENAPEGAKLYWLAYPDAEASEDDTIAEFYDDAGAEIETVPAGKKIVVSSWFNEGVKYSPVIAVK